jgi:hypothetical protein
LRPEEIELVEARFYFFRISLSLTFFYNTLDDVNIIVTSVYYIRPYNYKKKYA